MGTNTGENYRQGQVKNRVQVFNPKNNTYVKINTETGKIMTCKKIPYKGIKQKK